ncbi:MAG: NUDIX domain-containing protein [Micrococcales bacterium]|nr:NUDIX domain-containing protein [Micrococcales bacterium]
MVRSAGILLSRRGGAEVLLGHMGGPFWARREERAWSIPKGEIDRAESDLEAAVREFGEELGIPVPDAPYRPLGEFRQRSGKVVVVFHAEADLDVSKAVSTRFELEWPPRSGRLQSVPELDRIRWVPVAEARRLLVAGQVPVLDAL